jgi:hypothetical protein
MYLSDVDAGGGTDFPRLGITVMPKKGRALLWPSVYNTGTSKLGNDFDGVCSWEMIYLTYSNKLLFQLQ